MASENKIRRIAGWVVSVLLTVVFLMAGAMKLLGKAAGMFDPSRRGVLIAGRSLKMALGFMGPRWV